MIESMTPEQLLKLRHFGALLGMEEDLEGFPYEPSEWREADTPDVRGLKTRTLRYFDPLHDCSDCLRLVLFFGLSIEQINLWLVIRNRAGRMVKAREFVAYESEQQRLEAFRAAVFDAAYIVSHDPLGMAENPARSEATAVGIASLYGSPVIHKTEPDR